MPSGFWCAPQRNVLDIIRLDDWRQVYVHAAPVSEIVVNELQHMDGAAANAHIATRAHDMRTDGCERTGANVRGRTYGGEWTGFHVRPVARGDKTSAINATKPSGGLER